jgi:hypothetical protein
MPSQTQTRRSSRLRSSAARKIQKQFRSRKRKRSKASRKIQSRVRGRQTRKVINREKNTSTTVDDCSICLEPLTKDVRIALPCGHRYHDDCIRRSLTSTGGRCPRCRAVVTNIPYVPEGRANRTFGNVPLSQQQPQLQPPAPPAILNPTLRRQYILQRMQQIEMLEQRLAQLPDPREIPNITLNQALHIQYNARQIINELRPLFYEASENYQNYRNVRTNGSLDQDVTNMYYIMHDLLNRAQVVRNNATQFVDELGDEIGYVDEPPDLM